MWVSGCMGMRVQCTDVSQWHSPNRPPWAEIMFLGFQKVLGTMISLLDGQLAPNPETSTWGNHTQSRYEDFLRGSGRVLSPDLAHPPLTASVAAFHDSSLALVRCGTHKLHGAGTHRALTSIIPGPISQARPGTANKAAHWSHSFLPG